MIWAVLLIECLDFDTLGFLMKLIRLIYIILLLIFAGLGCQPKETIVETVRIKPSGARGEKLGRTLLHLAPNGKVAERLINEGADVNAQDSIGMMPMHTAVIANHRDVAEVLVNRGADINAKTHHGQTPLFWAVTKNHKDIAEWLIARGADVNTNDNYGIMPPSQHSPRRERRISQASYRTWSRHEYQRQ